MKMRTLYIDCGMGAAGDMLTAALYELLPEDERKKAIDELNNIGIPGVEFVAERATKCGITGTHMSVLIEGHEEGEEEHHHHHDHDHDHDHEHEHHHHHASMHDIEYIVSGLKISESVRDNVIKVYSLIAEAESHAHGRPVSEIHFHEVGTMDAIADVTAVCLMMEKIAPDRVIASPIHVGSGHVHCAHGILPVPAPATAYILQGIPTYSADIDGELCTPTGAALLKTFVDEFGNQPIMKVNSIGYGCGKKEFKRANLVRTMLGDSDEITVDHLHTEGQTAENKDSHFHTETQSAENASTHTHHHVDQVHGHDSGMQSEDPHGTHVVELQCNVDDMTGEELGFAMERLLASGAREVFYIPVQMKKSRPGVLLTVICSGHDKEQIVREIFKHTTTIGIRETGFSRYILDRRSETVDTPYGPVRKKISEGYGVTREKYEYDDLSHIAAEKGLSIREVRETLI